MDYDLKVLIDIADFLFLGAVIVAIIFRGKWFPTVKRAYIKWRIKIRGPKCIWWTIVLIIDGCVRDMKLTHCCRWDAWRQCEDLGMDLFTSSFSRPCMHNVIVPFGVFMKRGLNENPPINIEDYTKEGWELMTHGSYPIL